MIKESHSAQAVEAVRLTIRQRAKGVNLATTAQPTVGRVTRAAKCVSAFPAKFKTFVANLNKQPDRVYSGGMARNVVNQSFDRSG